MNIGFDGSRAFVSDKTGTENYSYQLLKALSKIDRKNKYIVYLRSFPSPGDWPENFQFITINWPRLWTQGGLALQTFKEKLDLLFVPSHTLPIIRRPGLKTVVTVHDLGSEYLPSMHQLKQRAYLGLMQKYQLKGATKIIAVSKATKEDLVKKIGLEPEKIEVVYEGFDEKLFKPSPNDTLVNSLIPYSRRDQGSERSEGSYFLFVGTIQPRKNLERIIKAFSIYLSLRGAKQRSNLAKYESQTRLPRPFGARNDDYKLVIVGSKGWMSDEIYRLPKKLGIEKLVKFLPPEGGRVGYVPDKDLPALYSGAQALVFPSLFEGFGLPILEAQACGCPVITSDISSMPEVAGKGAILVDPYSVDDIANAMIRVQQKEERVKLIKAGFENVKRFSWEKCAKETLEILESESIS